MTQHIITPEAEARLQHLQGLLAAYHARQYDLRRQALIDRPSAQIIPIRPHVRLPCDVEAAI